MPLSELGLLLALLLAAPVHAAEEPLFADTADCVAYRAQKSMFLGLSKSAVIGKNCDVRAEVLPELRDRFRLEVVVPIKSFDSGSAQRDKDVAQTLKLGVKPDLVYRSKALTVDEWHELLSKQEFPLEGKLSVGDKFYPIQISAHLSSGGVIEGMAHVHFSDFELPPPKVVGGLVATTAGDFDLLFHLQTSRILAADSIRPTPPTEGKK